jgi:hypothetical protein
MKSNRLYLIAALSPVLVLAAAAQTPPPPPVDVSAPPPPPTVQVQEGLPATHTSRVNAVAYGPQGEVVALTLRNGVAVTLTPRPRNAPTVERHQRNSHTGERFATCHRRTNQPHRAEPYRKWPDIRRGSSNSAGTAGYSGRCSTAPARRSLGSRRSAWSRCAASAGGCNSTPSTTDVKE